MNFFTVGTIFLLFQLKIGWVSNYAVKFIGLLLFRVGVGEMTDLCRVRAADVRAQRDEASRKYADGLPDTLVQLKKLTVSAVIACALTIVCMLGLKLLRPSETVSNAVSIILGAAVTVIALNVFRQVIVFIDDNGRLTSGFLSFVNDRSNVTRLLNSFVKLNALTLANLLFDVINRVVPIEFISGLAGFLMAITKVILYVYIIVAAYQFNKIRVDYNKKQDKTDG